MTDTEHIKDASPVEAFGIKSNPIKDIKVKLEELTNQQKAMLIKDIKSSMYTPTEDNKEQHLTTKIFFTAYRHMLDTNQSAKNCIIHAAKVHMKDVELVLAEKSNPSGRLSSKVVKKHNEHPIQKDMIKLKTFNRQALNNSKNLWQLLNTLSTFRQNYQWLKDLWNKVSSMESKLHLQSAEINRLNDLVGLGSMTDKEKLKYLKQSGLSNVQIAQVIGVTVRTVSRWIAQEGV